MTIILILVSLMLPALARGIRKARGLGNHLGGPGGIQMRIGEVATKAAVIYNGSIRGRDRV